MGQKKIEEFNSDYFWLSYCSWARTIRYWFIAFGVGVPAILLINPGLLDRIGSSGNADCIFVLYSAAILSQVGLSLVYKAVMSAQYTGHLIDEYEAHVEDDRRKIGRYKPNCLTKWVSECASLEMILDLVTLFLLVWATSLVFQAVVSQG